MNREIGTVADRLDEALAIGRRIKAIRANAGLWSLSRAAWLRQTIELGGWRELADVKTARDRLAALYPHLTAELRILARRWADGAQDRPAPWHVNGDRFPAAYVELIASGMNHEQVSAVACLWVVELRDVVDFRWGTANSLSPADGDATLQPHLDRLAVLDRQLYATGKWGSIHWDGLRPTIEHAGYVIEMTSHTAQHLASTLTERALHKC